MKLEKLAAAISAVKAYKLDAIDIVILDEVMRTKRVAGEVTIMEIVDNSTAASPATVHARIKALTNKKLLQKTQHSTNLSYKILEKGTQYDDLVKILGEV